MVGDDTYNAFSLSRKKHHHCTLHDLVSMEQIEQLLQALHKIINVPIGLVSPESDLLLSIGWQPICEQFHRQHPVSAACCVDSNNQLQARLKHNKVAAAKCQNGLWDIAMPIVVDDRHVATLFLGQFFYDDEQVDTAFFQTQAEKYAFETDAYMDAVAQVPRISRQEAEDHISYAVGLVALLAELGYKNLQLAQEIEERKLAEYALREGERQYKALVENVPGVVYQCLNDDAYTLIFISEEIEGLTGYNAAQMVDTSASLASIIHPDDLPHVYECVNNAVARKEPYVISYRMCCKGGGYTWVEERGQGVWDETHTLRFLQGVIFDVSERKKLEEERRSLEEQMARAQKLESLGVLAGGIAHDFNNLLVAILGHADLIFEEAAPNTNTYDSVNAIIQAAQRATNLTRQMLAYSGKGHFMVEPVNLSALVRDLAPLFENSIAPACRFQYELSDDAPPIYADAQQLKQLLTNLVTNAVESYEENVGAVTIRTGVAHCDVNFIENAYHNEQHPAGEYVYLEVADEGCGMCEETRRRLCDPFFTTKFTGRGLGMAAVLGIVRGHKGLMAVDSAPGKGSAVRVLFSAFAAERSAPASTPKQAGKKPRYGRILLVDDEIIVRNVVQKMLERGGFEVLVAQSGWEALQLLDDHREDIACILLDLTMPNMDGAKTLQAIREKNKRIPVILSSGYSEEEATSRLRKHQIAAFLQKPYKASTLVRLLQRVLQ